MAMDQRLPAFLDEMEKIAVSVRDSSFRQTRRGRRPIRVETLLKKETAFKTRSEEPPPDSKSENEQTGDTSASYEAEAGAGLQEGPG